MNELRMQTNAPDLCMKPVLADDALQHLAVGVVVARIGLRAHAVNAGEILVVRVALVLRFLLLKHGQGES